MVAYGDSKDPSVEPLLPDESLPEKVVREEKAAVTKQHKKRDDIQGLRAVAIIYVFAFHLYPKHFPNGFVGVDIFFVLSGYLITMILSRSSSLNCSAVINFAAKRFKRIFPAYYIMLVILLAISPYYIIPVDRDLLIRDTKWAMGFATNILKLINEQDYFAQLSNYDFLLHTWSLAVEIQFYIVAPFLIFFRQNVPFSDFFLVTLGLASLTMQTVTAGSLSFSFTASRMWQFIVGGISYSVEKFLAQYNTEGTEYVCSWRWKILNIISLIIISPIFIMVQLNQQAFRVIATFATGIIVVGRYRYLVDKIISHKYIVFIGDISYSLYLAHWPTILLIKYVRDHESITILDAHDAIVISFIAAYFSYNIIETFFIKSDTKWSILFITVMCFSSVFLMHYSFTSSGIPLPDKDFDNYTYEGSGDEEYNITYAKLTESLRKKALTLNHQYMNEWQTLVKVEKNDPNIDGMFKKNQITEAIGTYRSVKGEGNTTVVIFGNAAANVAYYMMKRVFGEDRYKEITSFIGNGCSPYLNIGSDNCKKFTETAVKVIEQKKPNIIFLIYFANDSVSSKVQKNLSNDFVFQQMQKTIYRISNVTNRIVLPYDTPWHTWNIGQRVIDSLANRKPLENVTLTFDEFWSHQHYASWRIDGLHCPKCERLSPHQEFCDHLKCRVFDPKTYVSYYYDHCQLNRYGAEHLGKFYKEIVDELYAREYFV